MSSLPDVVAPNADSSSAPQFSSFFYGGVGEDWRWLPLPPGTEDVQEIRQNSPVLPEDLSVPKGTLSIMDIDPDSEIFISDDEVEPVDDMPINKAVMPPPYSFSPTVNTPGDPNEKYANVCIKARKCNNANHRTKGLFASGHSKESQQEEIKALAHIWTILNSTIKEKDKSLVCYLCKDNLSREFYELQAHVTYAHGHKLGTFYQKYDIFDTIKETVHKRKKHQTHTPPPIPLVCNTCHLVCNTPIELLIHSNVQHPALENALNYCPDCFVPLTSTSYALHWKDYHKATCCQMNFSSLTSYLNHRFRDHFSDVIVQVREGILKKMYETTKSNPIRTLWDPNMRTILSTNRYNSTMPGLYSQDFINIVRDVNSSDQPLHRILLPYENYTDLKNLHKDKWSALPYEEAILRDATLQHYLNIEMQKNLNKMSYTHANIFLDEISHTVKTLCSFCRDNTSHENKENCIDFATTTPESMDTNNMKLSAKKINSYAAILIGATSQSYGYLGKTKYPILNLSDYSRDIKYATGTANYANVIYNPSGRHIYIAQVVKDYFRIIRNVISMLSVRSHQLIFIEFFPFNTEDISKLDIFYQITSFINETLKVKKEFDCNIVVLPPIRRYKPDMTPTEYMHSHKVCQWASSILSAVCTKVNVPCFINSGEIVSVSNQLLNTGTWLGHEENENEPLYNSNGTSTRELKRRMARMMDQILSAWTHVIEECGHLRRFYLNNLVRGHYEYPIGDIVFSQHPQYDLSPAPGVDVVG